MDCSFAQKASRSSLERSDFDSLANELKETFHKRQRG